MTKKDYELIAKDIKLELARSATKETTEAITNLALVFCLSFRVDNIRFSDTKFLTACGIEGAK